MKKALLLAATLSLAACGDPGEATEQALSNASGKAAEDGRIECAVDGSDSFRRICTLERVADPTGTTLTIIHPSGGFRRLRVAGDGRGVVAADGAEPAIVSVSGDKAIEVALAGDRYRLPATIKGR